MERNNMTNTLKMNLTLDGNTIETSLPVESDMPFVDFFLILQLFLTKLPENVNKVTTFDVYNLNFERIALVGNNNELYIDENYGNFEVIQDLFDNDIDTIEVIGLGTSSVSKVLQEEKYLKDALDNYEF